jgi:hypothetical protein
MSASNIKHQTANTGDANHKFSSFVWGLYVIGIGNSITTVTNKVSEQNAYGSGTPLEWKASSRSLVVMVMKITFHKR